MTELISNPIRIPCGGFDIDNDILYFQNDVLKSKREEPELPSVSAEDNGDVLTVVNGSWAKATPSSGGVMVVHAVNEVLDKTWQEIADAAPMVWQAISNPENTSIVYSPLNVVSSNPTNSMYSLKFVTQTMDGADWITFKTDSPSGYPVLVK